MDYCMDAQFSKKASTNIFVTLVPLNYDEVVFHAIKFRYTSYRCVQFCMNIYTRDPFDRHVKGIKTWTIPVKKKDWYEKNKYTLDSASPFNIYML